MTRALTALCVVVLLTGCASEPRTIHAGSSDPAAAPAGGATGRRVVDSSPAASDEPGRRPAVAQALSAAARDFADAVSGQNARGWPPHVVMSSSMPPRPRARVTDIVNQTRQHADVSALADELTQRLVEQGVLEIAVRHDDDLEAVMDERAYAQAAEDGSFEGEDPVALLIRGTITDEVVVDEDGERTTTIIVVLRLIDTARGSVLTQSRTVMRSER